MSGPIPKVVETGILRCGKVEIRVHLLDNGKRVIALDEERFEAALDAATEEEAGAFGRAMAEFFIGSNEPFERYRREVMN